LAIYKGENIAILDLLLGGTIWKHSNNPIPLQAHTAHTKGHYNKGYYTLEGY